MVNLFSPVAAGQARLIDSQLVSTYINPDYKYTIYQPTAWIARAVDETTHKDVMFTALSGEFVEITALPFPTGQAFPDWFHQNFPNEVLATYQPFTNRFHVSGIMSPDKTVAFITDGGSVYLIRYDGGTREEINYRSTFVMMVQSFKTATVATPIELLPLTSVGTPTALGVIATSSPEIAIPETTATGPAFMATTSTLPVVVSTSTAATSTLVAPTSTP